MVSVDIVADERSSGGGVGGAAGGAALGFLLAGPAGTLLGARIGSKKKGVDNTTAVITWADGNVWAVERLDVKELSALKVAAASFNPKKSSLNDLEKIPENKTITKEKTTQRKPKKLPKEDWELELPKDFKEGRKTSLPSIEYISELRNLNGNKNAVKVFNETLRESLESYNNWKWQYFNLKIETTKEIKAVAKLVLKNLIADWNEALKKKKIRKDLEFKIEKNEQQIKKYTAELKIKQNEIDGAGFFKKNNLKKEFESKNKILKNCKQELASSKRSLTSIDKKLLLLEDILQVDRGNLEFILIYETLFPSIKKPSASIKTRTSLLNQVFLDIYREVFDETWDQRIILEKNKLKDKENKKVKINDKKEIPLNNIRLSKKDKILELEELFNEGLISNEELSKARKKVLGLN